MSAFSVPGDARLVEEDVGAAQLGRLHLDHVGELVRRAELLEREEVRVEPPPADHVAPRRRQRDAAAPAEDRAREEDRAADALGERAVEALGLDGPRVYAHGVPRRPGDLDAERRDQVDERLEVADARDVLERDRLVGEERGGDDREGRVLVARRADRARERATALDEELHGGRARHGGDGSRGGGRRAGRGPAARRALLDTGAVRAVR
jgi:hypothetical protein